IATVEIAVAVLVHRCHRYGRVTEAALRAEDIRKLKLPRQMHQAVNLESMAESKIRWAAIEFGAIVKHARLRHEIAIARKVRCACIGPASIADNRGHPDKTIGGIWVASAERSRIQIGVEGVVIFRNE